MAQVFFEFKEFVEKSLNIEGKWTYPGGDVKLFKSVGEGEFSIKWYGHRSKRLFILSDNPDNYLNLKFQRLSNQCRIANDISQEVAGEILESEVCYRPESGVCSCVSRPFVTQLVDLKADIATLESRFNCDLVSEVNSLRTEQYHLTSMFRKQDQIIHNLIDENSFIKSKMLWLESLFKKQSIMALRTITIAYNLNRTISHPVFVNKTKLSINLLTRIIFQPSQI